MQSENWSATKSTNLKRTLKFEVVNKRLSLGHLWSQHGKYLAFCLLRWYIWAWALSLSHFWCLVLRLLLLIPFLIWFYVHSCRCEWSGHVFLYKIWTYVIECWWFVCCCCTATMRPITILLPVFIMFSSIILFIAVRRLLIPFKRELTCVSVSVCANKMLLNYR